MTKLIIALVQGNDRDGYRLHPNCDEYAGLTIAEWKAICAEDGVVVTENDALDGRVENQHCTVYHCAMPPDAQGVVYHSIDVCVWEETDENPPH